MVFNPEGDNQTSLNGMTLFGVQVLLLQRISRLLLTSHLPVAIFLYGSSCNRPTIIFWF